MTKHRRLVIH